MVLKVCDKGDGGLCSCLEALFLFFGELFEALFNSEDVHDDAYFIELFRVGSFVNDFYSNHQPLYVILCDFKYLKLSC